MSKTFRREKTKDRLVKFEDKRTGWLGEEASAQEGRKFIKELEHRHNRRVGKRQAMEGPDEKV